MVIGQSGNFNSNLGKDSLANVPAFPCTQAIFQYLAIAILSHEAQGEISDKMTGCGLQMTQD
jgi:hypothetical protein